MFGGNRRAIEAGRYDVDAAAANRNAVLLSIIGEVARRTTHRSARRADAPCHPAATTSQRRRAVPRLWSRSRYVDRGLTNDLDLQLAVRRELARLRSPSCRRCESRHPGQPNTASPYCWVNIPRSWPMNSHRPGNDARPACRQSDAGLPVDLIERRPDIREAERQLARRHGRALALRPRRCFRVSGSAAALGRT